MKLRYTAVFCLTGLAACSNQSNQPEVQDPADVSAASEPSAPMSPASLEQRSSASSAVPRPATTPGPATTPAAVDARPAPNAERASGPSGTASTSGSKADDTARTSPDVPAAPDNTKVNQRDTNASALTPMDQNNNSADLKITQQIRQAVMADGSLSFTAKNVKIITQGGKVTLRGPVNNAQERSNIEAAARKIAGVTQVDNQLEVKK
jgi:hyperosmotically inducible protein